MKIDMPTMPENTPTELLVWLERVSDLLNKGLYAPKLLTAAPALGDLNTGEMAIGVGTGGSGEHEIFVKVNSTTIARWTHDSTIT